MHANLARRMDWLRASDIREMLKVTQRPDMISLAGGLPAPEIFPVAELAAAAARILAERGEVALQYATSEGHVPLREKIAARMNRIYGTKKISVNNLFDRLRLIGAGRLVVSADSCICN